MLEALPDPLREPLWQLKHSVVSWFVRHGFAESFHVVLKEQLAAARPTVALDVGANRGQYAQLLRRLGFVGPIFSFEPIPENVQFLQRRSSAEAHWKIIPCALGDEETKLSFNVMDEDVFSSFLGPTEFAREEMEAATIVKRVEQIEVHRAENLLPVLIPDLQQHRIHLKIDTQGYDTRVITGFGQYLTYVNSLQLELSIISLYREQDFYLDTLATIHRLGFQPTCLFPIIRDKELHLIEIDALFRRLG
jgi:FkbM family methyltransferase